MNQSSLSDENLISCVEGESGCADSIRENNEARLKEIETEKVTAKILRDLEFNIYLQESTDTSIRGAFSASLDALETTGESFVHTTKNSIKERAKQVVDVSTQTVAVIGIHPSNHRSSLFRLFKIKGKPMG